VVSGLLSDLAAIQADKHKTFGYKRAAAVVLSLDDDLEALAAGGRPLPKIAGLGPSSLRVVGEVLETGGSATVEAAVESSGKRDDIMKRRQLREGFLSRAAVLQVLRDSAFDGISRNDHRGDLQMHSTWSDGVMTLPELVEGCITRGYEFAAVTDHSHGLPVARGMAAATVIEQHRAIEALNTVYSGRFRLLRGIEANIDADGALDLSAEDTAAFDIVLAAPHSKLRVPGDQTARLIRALESPGVNILAHPRGRMRGTRAGIVANWPLVFARARTLGVAIEIDGDPSRQDLDYSLARQAYEAGCLLALDSDAHSTAELAYADTAIAHARLGGIPASAIVNCWPLEQVLAWADGRRAASSGRRRAATSRR
jgi:histidinol phosphatase-like PHP family hydrolase